ncbi:NAD-dependent deacetylase [Rhodovulum imhoffii]|uniref:NAD-dependent protein deacylase n=1 Tax=Rhodovulum imhoffii TaxID=365340 RepID=A0A2T5BT80_9RHOB|nr:NAD-dependent deacylase [Rhodovulum imhoffii]MBK5932665.1 NAD-dependent protein deacylase [Rhodovulum imhoffii]PTN02519.1 NAD-dependent deacetylase [Rhodovulum imhoffii]
MARFVILTGAGISAESGLGTFRDKDGLWTRYDLREIATPEGFAANPRLVHDFYNARRKNAAEALPNAAHAALARLEKALPGEVLIITQNIDNLHERAGSRTVLHMHGDLFRARCTACGHAWDAPAEMAPGDPCPACAHPGTRPDIVWFGEFPYFMEEIWDALRRAKTFAAIGTSGSVYPAAAFVQDAARAGAHTLEINLEPSETVNDFAEARHGRASDLVPEWVNEVLARTG